MAKKEKYQEIILQTEKWFDNKVKQLNIIIDNKNDSKISFQGDNGEKVELPKELEEGFYFGIQTAIEVLGEFPVKITKTKKQDDGQ